MDTSSLTVAGLRKQIASRQITPVEALEQIEARIARIDPSIGAYLSRNFEKAKKEAEKADITKPLGGVPIAIKDVINVEGEPCTCASRILQGYTAPYDATAIRRLREAGAIPYGRLNMDEFAMGSSTENSAYQLTRNPWDSTRIPGGSSGGSAACVAATTAYASLGSDTGGSIRQPAALCGITGLKPTYGRISRYGLVAFASSLDQIGPFARTAEDCGLLLNAMSGHDPMDSTTLSGEPEDFLAEIGQDIKGLRIGIPKEYFIDGTHAGVSARIDEARKVFSDLGAELVEISLPHTEYATAVYYIIATAEASSNLARFDGVRYGQRAANAKNIIDQYLETRAAGFGPEVKRRILLGTYVLSKGYYDAYYLRAQKVRTLIRKDFTEAFAKVDVLLCPTSPFPAFRIGEKIGDPLQMYLSDIFTIAVNLAGNCAISLPCGFVEDDGKKLPVGLQLIADSGREARLLRFAHAYQSATSWHTATPPDIA